MGIWYEMIGQFGYISIFTLLSLGIIGLPIPIPDELILAYLGYITAMGYMDFTLTFIVALLGALCGVTISYFIGNKLGEPFIRKYGSKFWIRKSAIERMERLFQKYGSLAIFISYFVPGGRNVAACMGGITRFPFKQFALYAYAGSLFWVIALLWIGNRLGTSFVMITHFIHRYMANMIIIIILGAIIYGIYYFYRRTSKHRM